MLHACSCILIWEGMQYMLHARVQTRGSDCLFAYCCLVACVPPSPTCGVCFVAALPMTGHQGRLAGSGKLGTLFCCLLSGDNLQQYGEFPCSTHCLHGIQGESTAPPSTPLPSSNVESSPASLTVCMGYKGAVSPPLPPPAPPCPSLLWRSCCSH